MTPQSASVERRLLTLKVWFAVFDLATLALVIRLLRLTGRPAGLCVVYAWCPLVLKEIIDALDQPRPELVVPLALILGYGVLRFASTTFADLRDVIFAKVTQRAMRRISMAVFKHLHALSLRFHLERQTGVITRDIGRGARALSSLVGYLLFRITPTVLEILMVAGILFVKLD